MFRTIVWRAVELAFWAAVYAYGFLSLPEGGPGTIVEKVSLIVPWLGQAWPALLLMTAASLAAGWTLCSMAVERRSKKFGATGDMPMREFFRFLRFRSQWAGNFKDIESWTTATWQSVEDRLGSGELRCWGRSSVERVGATHPPPRLLDTSIWTGVRLDMMSVMSDRFEEFAQTRPIYKNHAKIIYYDLHVNKLQAYEYWKPSYGPARLLYRWRLVDYVFDGESAVWFVRSIVRESRRQAGRAAMRAWKRCRLLFMRVKRQLKQAINSRMNKVPK